MNNNFPIFVTRPSLPPLEEFIPSLKKIWDNKILTNGGPFHAELEDELCSYLGVPFVSLFSNGTIALLTALQALNLHGEVITTPYSFVATSNSLLWNKIKPVFVDIDPLTLNIDPKKIEAAITPNTTAILPVHCYGTPCDVKAIKEIADKHKIRVIYDAAHAFEVKSSAGSILSHGDLSVLSFHATKVFNTFEGGAIICHDLEMKKRIDQLKNFGFADETTVIEPGINGKMSELNAAFGLLQLKYVAENIHKRKNIDYFYRKHLVDITGISFPTRDINFTSNYSYFPIIIDDPYPLSRDALYDALKSRNIFSRKYFYPLISDFPIYQDLPSASASNLSVASKVAKTILCLPIYPELDDSDIFRIIQIISEGKP